MLLGFALTQTPYAFMAVEVALKNKKEQKMIQDRDLRRRIKDAFLVATKNSDLLTTNEIEELFVDAFSVNQEISALIKFFWYDHNDSDLDNAIDFVMGANELKILRYALYVATDMDLTILVLEYKKRKRNEDNV